MFAPSMPNSAACVAWSMHWCGDPLSRVHVMSVADLKRMFDTNVIGSM